MAAALALAAAGGCGRRGGPPPERWLPAGARAAVVVPRLDAATPQVSALLDTAAAFPGAGDLAGWRAAATAQLGFDPLDRRSLSGAGIDPARGAGFASGTLVLPVRDAALLADVLARIARDRLGAPERGRERRGAVEIVTFRPAAGGPHRDGRPASLSYAVVDGATAILAPGPQGPELVAAAAALAPEASLAGSAAWKTARAALGDGHTAFAFVPPGSPLLAGAWGVRDGLAAGLSGGGARLRVVLAVLLGDRAPGFRALAGAGAAPASRLDPDAALAGAWHGDPAALGKKLVPFLGPRERARLAAAGLDAQRDLFELLAPGAAAAVSLAPGLDVASLSEERLRADPLRLLQFEGVATVRDADRARAVSERIAAAAARRGPRKGAPAEGTTWRVTTPSGEIAWRLDGARLAVAGGAPGRLDRLLARLGSGDGFRAPTRDAAAALEGGLGGAVLDVPRLVASVRALPDDAYGTGPNAFVMRSVVERFAAPADRLAAISVRAELAEGALLVAIEAETRAGERP